MTPSFRAARHDPGRSFGLWLLCGLSITILGCGFLSPKDNPNENTNPELFASSSLLFVGDRATLFVERNFEDFFGVHCLDHWTLGPEGTADKARLEVMQNANYVTFTASAPGRYTVLYRCGQGSASVEFNVYAAQRTVQASGPVHLNTADCRYAALTQRERLLCNSNGIHVFDPQTGTELSSSEAEGVRLNTGPIISSGDFFATVLGCESCGPGHTGIATGVYLYQLGADDRPKLVSNVAQIGAQQLIYPVGFFNERLYLWERPGADSDDVLQVDVHDPLHPQPMGCVRQKAALVTPAPGGSLFMLADDGLRAYAPGSFQRTCPSPGMPLGGVDLLAVGWDFGGAPSMVAQAGILYIPGGRGVNRVDAGQPSALRLLPTLALKPSFAAVQAGMLFIAESGRVVVYDLTDQAAPVPVARWPQLPHSAQLFALRDKMLVVLDNKLFTLTVQ